MFTPSNRPRPFGVLTDLNDKWVLIWGGENGIVNYAFTERLSNGEIVNLTAETAVWYVRYILEEVNQALNIEIEGSNMTYVEENMNIMISRSKRKKIHHLGEVNKSDVGQIHDFFNEMSSEEIECFKIKQAKLSLASSPWYPPVNDTPIFMSS